MKQSVRLGSMFKHRKVNLKECMQLMYFWARNYNQVQVQAEGNFSVGCIVEWFRAQRQACLEVLLEDSLTGQLGGPQKIVEIDETKIGKRKYHRGHRVEGAWVFGAIEREGEQGFKLCKVHRRDAPTLMGLIKRWIRPGSIIMSDCWKAYDGIAHQGFQHLKVNHKLTFKNPETGACTNLIEGSWLHVKKNLPKYGTSKKWLSGYLAEYLWKRQVRRKGADPFLAVCGLLKEANQLRLRKYSDWDHAYSACTPQRPEGGRVAKDDHNYSKISLVSGDDHTYSRITPFVFGVMKSVLHDHAYTSTSGHEDHTYALVQ